MPESAGWHNKTNPHVRNGFAQRGRGVAGPFSLFDALIEPPELSPCWNPRHPFIGRSWPRRAGEGGTDAGRAIVGTPRTPLLGVVGLPREAGKGGADGVR